MSDTENDTCGVEQKCIDPEELKLREVQHRLTNMLIANLSAVGNQLHIAKEPETKAALNYLLERMKMQMRVFELLQLSGGGRVPLKALLDAVIASADATYLSHEESSRVNHTLEEVYVRQQDAQMIGMIVNELITNAYKHVNHSGAAYNLLVQSEPEGRIIISYKDNGAGMDEDAISEHTRGRINRVGGGFRQVAALVRELRGSLTVNGDDGLHVLAKVNPRP